MPRARIIRTSKVPYHVTARSNNRDWYSLPLSEMWTIFESTLLTTAERYQLVVYAFVLMSNHFHLILLTPQQNISQAMRYFLTEVSREVGRRTGRINHVFGGRYRSSVLWEPRDLAYVYKYVLRNPVRAGLCQKVEEYQFSSLTCLLQRRCSFPVADGFNSQWIRIPRRTSVRIDWLNTSPNSQAEQLIARGIRRVEFKIPDDKNLAFLRGELVRGYGIETEGESVK